MLLLFLLLQLLPLHLLQSSTHNVAAIPIAAVENVVIGATVAVVVADDSTVVATSVVAAAASSSVVVAALIVADVGVDADACVAVAVRCCC